MFTYGRGLVGEGGGQGLIYSNTLLLLTFNRKREERMADRRIFGWPRARQARLDFGEKSLLLFVCLFVFRFVF